MNGGDSHTGYTEVEDDEETGTTRHNRPIRLGRRWRRRPITVSPARWWHACYQIPKAIRQHCCCNI